MPKSNYEPAVLPIERRDLTYKNKLNRSSESVQKSSGIYTPQK